MGATAGLLLPSCKGELNRPLWSADTQPADFPTVRAVDYMSDILAKETGGRLSIKTYFGSQLGSERDTLEMTIFGGLDLNRVNLTPLNPIASATLVPALPFLFTSTRHMRAAMDGEPGQKILAALAPHGLKGLCFYDSGARSFYTTGKAINSPDDFAGMKIRVQNSEMAVAMVEALGANPVPMNFSEVYQALVQGVVDGAENNWPSYDSTRHFEAAPVYSLTEHTMVPEVLVMSMNRWRSLSSADQTLVSRAALTSVKVMRKLWDERVERSRAALIKADVKLIRPSGKDAFQDRMKSVYERFVTPQLQPLVDEIAGFSRDET